MRPMSTLQPSQAIEALIDNIETVIIGKTETVELAVVTLLAGGHMLIEDVPGVGKTMLARSLAKSLDCSFKRIQFTPDLLPSDITGVSVFDRSSESFKFRPGPIFANIVLADEVNRATPKSQAALLECMEEFQVTVDGITHQLPKPFFVMATENLVEYEGTYRLPEAQLDRFLACVSLGYPHASDEVKILDDQVVQHPIELVKPVLSPEQLLELQRRVRQVHLDDSLKQYIVELTRATRQHPAVELGASPRGSLALMRLSQALAAVRRRDYVIPDDIKYVAPAALGHRIILASDAAFQGTEARDVIEEVLTEVAVPAVSKESSYETA